MEHHREHAEACGTGSEHPRNAHVAALSRHVRVRDEPTLTYRISYHHGCVTICGVYGVSEDIAHDHAGPGLDRNQSALPRRRDRATRRAPGAAGDAARRRAAPAETLPPSAPPHPHAG